MAEGDAGDGLTVIGAGVVGLGFLFLFGIINDAVVAGEVEQPV